MTSFGDIAKQIQGVINFFAGNQSPSLYPENKDVTNEIKAKNWNKTLPYSFKVVTQTLVAAGGAPGTAPQFGEFILHINPTDLQQDEQFSLQITPTQGGIVVEHNGIVFKNLTISGTTGVHPFRGEGGVTNSGKVIAGEPTLESGYEHFQKLRNYFRAYADKKKTEKDYRLLFINKKDNEVFFVEPELFSLKRSASRRFLYDYAIQLRVLGIVEAKPFTDDPTPGIFEKIDNFINDVTEKLTIARGVMLKNQSILTNIEGNIAQTFLEPLRQITLACKATAGVAYTALDMPSSLKNSLSQGTKKYFWDAINSLKQVGDAGLLNTSLPKNTYRMSQKNFDSIDALGPAVVNKLPLTNLTSNEQQAFNSDVSMAQNNSRQFYETFKVTSTRISDNAAEYFGLGSPAYNEFIGRQQTFVPTAGRKPSNDEADVLDAFNVIEDSMNYLLATNLLFKHTLERDINQISQLSNQHVNVAMPQSAIEIIIPFDTTLEDLAGKYLGTPERWIDIAVLNDLKPPYIQEGSIDLRVKNPGDKLLIPSSQQPFKFDIPVTKDYPITHNLSPAEKNLGVDLKLSAEFDLVFTNTGDYALIAGPQNAGQAVIIKLSIEKGSLKYHTDIGASLSIGEKMVNADAVRDEVTEAILKDPRFEKINNIAINITGNTIEMRIDLKVRGIQQPIPLTLPL